MLYVLALPKAPARVCSRVHLASFVYADGGVDVMNMPEEAFVRGGRAHDFALESRSDGPSCPGILDSAIRFRN